MMSPQGSIANTTVEHHTIYFASNYKKNIEGHHARVARPRKTCRSTSGTLAGQILPVHPPAHSALYILAPVSNNTSGVNWQEYKHRVS